MSIDVIYRLMLFFVTCTGALCGHSADVERLAINDRRWHLGQRGGAEWDEYAAHPPDAQKLDLSFNRNSNASESTLFIRQDDVRQDWIVELNGRRLGKLFLMEADLVSSFAVPAGTIRDGENRLPILPPKIADDIVVNEIWLKRGTVREAIQEVALSVRIQDKITHQPLPGRVTILNNRGSLVPLTAVAGSWNQPLAAIRPGVAYVGTGGAMLLHGFAFGSPVPLPCGAIKRAAALRSALSCLATRCVCGANAPRLSSESTGNGPVV